MKDFDDYLKVLTSDESKAEIDQIIVDSALEEQREGSSLPVYLYALIDAITDYKLRKYHEWVSE